MGPRRLIDAWVWRTGHAYGQTVGIMGNAGPAIAKPIDRARRLKTPGRIQVTALALTLCLCGSVGPSASAQTTLRRGSPVQPISGVERGDLMIGVGVAFESAVELPLIASGGDLRRVGITQLSYGVANGVLIEIRGDLYRILTVDDLRGGSSEANGSAIPKLDEDLADGTASGAGDFEVGILFRLLGAEEGLSVGGRFHFNIPSSDEDQGLGTNSLTTRMSLLGSYGRGRVRLSGDLGVGILEAPVENFEQNDVLVYSAEFLYVPLVDRPLRLFAGLNGRASTRDRVPLGTEDLGQMNLGVDYKLGHWLLDVFGTLGYAGLSAEWGFGFGAAFLIPDRR